MVPGSKRARPSWSTRLRAHMLCGSSSCRLCLRSSIRPGSPAPRAGHPPSPAQSTVWPGDWLSRASEPSPNLTPVPATAVLSISEVMLCICTFWSLHSKHTGKPHLTPHCMWMGLWDHLWPAGKKWWYEACMHCPRKHSWSQALRRHHPRAAAGALAPGGCMEEAPLPLTASLLGRRWKQLPRFSCRRCEISSCTCLTAQPSQPSWLVITSPPSPLSAPQIPGDLWALLKGLRLRSNGDVDLSSSPPLLLVWLCCPSVMRPRCWGACLRRVQENPGTLVGSLREAKMMVMRQSSYSTVESWSPSSLAGV